MSVDGEEVSVRVVPHDDRQGIDILGHGWSSDVVSLGQDGEHVALDANGGLVVRPGSELEVSGRGFEPTSQVPTYLLSGPHTLGSLMTDRSGAFEGTVDVPSSLSAGEALQVNGFTPEREVRSVTLGVTVLRPADQRALGTQLTFARDSAKLTGEAKRRLRLMAATCKARDYLHTTVSGSFALREGTRGRVLAKTRGRTLGRFLVRLGIQGTVSFTTKSVTGAEGSRGRRMVVRSYCSIGP